jgi:acetyl esterase/lipase
MPAARRTRAIVVAIAGFAAMAALLAGCVAAPDPRSSALAGSPSPTRSTSWPTGSMEIQETNGIVFRSVADHDLTLDACVPMHATKAPVVVLVHGGSFSGGHPSDLDVVCRAAARHGYAAFSVDYRTLPTRWPAQVDDVAAAIDWIGRPAQVAQFHSDPTRIGLVGASAGATISAQLVTEHPGGRAAVRRVRGDRPELDVDRCRNPVLRLRRHHPRLRPTRTGDLRSELGAVDRSADVHRQLHERARTARPGSAIRCGAHRAQGAARVAHRAG